MPPADNWVAGHRGLHFEAAAACMWAKKLHIKASNDVNIQDEKIVTWNVTFN